MVHRAVDNGRKFIAKTVIEKWPHHVIIKDLSKLNINTILIHIASSNPVLCPVGSAVQSSGYTCSIAVVDMPPALRLLL